MPKRWVHDARQFQDDDDWLLLEESLKQLEELLGERVVRIHRNALVSRNALIGMEKDGEGIQHVTLREIGRGPEISRRHVAEVRRLLKAID